MLFVMYILGLLIYLAKIQELIGIKEKKLFNEGQKLFKLGLQMNEWLEFSL